MLWSQSLKCVHACIHSFHGYLLSTDYVHCSWCEDSSMNQPDETLPSWSLHSSRETEKQRNVQVLVTSIMMKNNRGEKIVMEQLSLFSEKDCDVIASS